MAENLDVAFLWHFHQPSYRRPGAGTPTLPWVRLHAARGYTDMLALLEEMPEVRVTLNVTPVLAEQLEAAAQGLEDDWLAVCRRNPQTWDPVERTRMVPLLLQAPRKHMVDPLPRFRELVERAEAEGAESFSDQDLLDLVVVFHLGWCGWHLRRDPRLQALLEQGRDFRPEQRDELLARMHRELSTLLDRAARLGQESRVELSSTPYGHPILPLLIDLDSRNHAAEGSGEEPFRFAWPEDARDHVTRAKQSHQRWFQKPPSGMWPAEGSVSEAAADLFAESGVSWIATDEAILKQTLGHDQRQEIYRAHRWRGASTKGDSSLAGAPRTGEGSELCILFRDQHLSDLIGFDYQHRSAEDAVDHFCGELDRIRQESTLEQPMVAVILDGENPWEHYEGAGEPFLRTLYGRLAADTRFRLSTVSDVVERHDENAPRLPSLASGSWIHGNFSTWAGHEEKRFAWSLLAKLRQHAGNRRLDEMPAELAESLRTLESSDWYWWLGEDHPTPGAAAFDELFLAHLRAGYRCLGLPVPALSSLRFHHDTLPTAPPESLVAEGIPGTLRGVFEVPNLGGSMSRGDAAVTLAFTTDDHGVRLFWAGPGGGSGLMLVGVDGERRELESPPDQSWWDVPWPKGSTWVRLRVRLPGDPVTDWPNRGALRIDR